MLEVQPARHGYPWSERDIEQLKHHVGKRREVEDIARRMGRTVRAICIAIEKFVPSFSNIRLRRYGGDIVINGKDYDVLIAQLRYNLHSRIELHASLGY